MGELEKTMAVLNKKFGKGFISSGSEVLDREYKRYPLGIFSFNCGTGGGLAHRKVMMLAGKESSGKTATALVAVGEVQKQGGKVAWVDAEHAFDPIWATKLGVDVGKLIVADPITVEQMSDTVEALIMTGELALLVVDSIISPPSTKALEESSEQKSMGGKAKAIGLMMEKITARLNDVANPCSTSVIIINQIRDKIGSWGNPTYTPGGHQLHHHSDIIVWLRPASKPLGSKDLPTGITIKFKTVKNRTAPPLRTGSYDLMFVGKIEEGASLIGLAVAKGIINKTGYKYTLREKSVTDIKPFTAALDEDDWKYIKEQLILKADVPVIEKDEDDELDLTVTDE